MSRLFANGTEGVAWMHVWCNVCVHEDDCETLIDLFCDLDGVPAAITEQPKGVFHLPPLHLCADYTPPSTGDPFTEVRANVVRYVTEHGSGEPTP
jgi:hypothetical protein